MSISAIIASSRARVAPIFVGAISDLNVTGFGVTTITLDWSTPTADNPLDYFEIYLDGVFFENTTDATEGWTITGLTAGTSYEITLKSVDDLGNKSDFSNEVVFSTDTTDIELSYASTTSLNLTLQTVSGNDVEVDWGDGSWVTYTSATTTRTKTFGASTSGTAKIRSAVGNPKSDINYVRSTTGTWNFNISALRSVTYYILFTGNSMALTGDISVLLNVSYYIYFNGNSMALNYSSTTWTTIPSFYFYLRLATGRLTASEVDNLFIDLEATGASGTAQIDFRGNNAAPTVTSSAARTALASRGYTILTN